MYTIVSASAMSYRIADGREFLLAQQIKPPLRSVVPVYLDASLTDGRSRTTALLY